jgi:cytochrome c biogenesis protein CcmG/thiol:disulfide interchange protein DsbE
MAPDFTAVDSTGARLRLSDFKGRVTVLNFWASWCAPCTEETPWFIEFQKKYGNDGLAVIGVSLDDDGWKSVRPFIGGMGVNYRTILADGQISRLYGGLEALPVTMIIDRSGRIAATQVGLIDHDNFEAAIQALLNP